jgi:hypothetical protein
MRRRASRPPRRARHGGQPFASEASPRRAPGDRLRASRLPISISCCATSALIATPSPPALCKAGRAAAGLGRAPAKRPRRLRRKVGYRPLTVEEEAGLGTTLHTPKTPGASQGCGFTADTPWRWACGGTPRRDCRTSCRPGARSGSAHQGVQAEAIGERRHVQRLGVPATSQIASS